MNTYTYTVHTKKLGEFPGRPVKVEKWEWPLEVSDESGVIGTAVGRLVYTAPLTFKQMLHYKLYPHDEGEKEAYREWLNSLSFIKKKLIEFFG